jgi:hypothetical protein
MPPAFPHRHPTAGWSAMLVGLALCLTAAPGRAQVGNTQHRIVVLTDTRTDHIQQVLHLAVNCDEEVRRLVERRPSLLQLYLQPAGKGLSVRGEMVFVGLDNETALIPLAYRCLRAALFRLAIELQPANRLADPEDIPDWITAALYHRLLDRNYPDVDGRGYAATRMLLDADRLPAWRTFVDRPFSAREPVFWQLYGQTADCLLRSVQRAAPTAVTTILQQLAEPIAPSTQLANLLPQHLGGPDGQLWVDAQIRRQVIRGDRPDSYQQVREAVNKLEHVAIMAPGDGGAYGLKNVLIEEVPQYLERYDYDRNNIESMMRTVFHLMSRSPYLLRDSLARYAAALDALKQGRRDQFIATIRAARQQFHADYARGLRIAEYLERTEARLSPPDWRLLRMAGTLIADMPATPYERALGSYLDRLSGPADSPAATPIAGGEKRSTE